jgi:ATP-dependent Clp protease protease subunit
MAAKSLTTRVQEAELSKLEAEARSYEEDILRMRAERASYEAQTVAQERENNAFKNHPLARGEFHLFSAVEEEVVHELILQMDTWKQKHPGDPITLYIDSPGGIVIDGFALCDYLEVLKREGHHITTVGLGLVASMAAIIHQLGDTRKMGKRSWLMIHEVSGVAAGSLTEQKDEIKLNDRLQGQALDILAEKSGVSKAQIKKRWVRKDWWMDSTDALKEKFVDEIL